MPDTLSTFTTLINSPPGVLVAGGVLAGIVWKFFDKVEEKLNDDTKLEIAVWLLGVKVGQKVESWPDTFAKVFDRVFGEKHLSWRCFWRSCIASYGALLLVLLYNWVLYPSSNLTLSTDGKESINLAVATSVLSNVLRSPYSLSWLLPISVVANLVPDYGSLLVSRLILSLLKGRTVLPTAVLLLIDFVVTVLIAGIAMFVGQMFTTARLLSANQQEYSIWFAIPSTAGNLVMLKHGLSRDWFVISLTYNGYLWFFPAFFTSIWLWLYAGSGFLLKFARRFDKSLGWFNRRFDIEHKPLSSIGLVSGALVALIYWAAVIVSRAV